MKELPWFYSFCPMKRKIRIISKLADSISDNDDCTLGVASEFIAKVYVTDNDQGLAVTISLYISTAALLLASASKGLLGLIGVNVVSPWDLKMLAALVGAYAVWSAWRSWHNMRFYGMLVALSWARKQMAQSTEGPPG